MRADVKKKDRCKKTIFGIDRTANILIKARLPVLVIAEYIFLMYRYIKEIGQYRESYNPLSPFTDMFANEYYPRPVRCF